jgi:hypothetical protein
VDPQNKNLTRKWSYISVILIEEMLIHHNLVLLIWQLLWFKNKGDKFSLSTSVITSIGDAFLLGLVLLGFINIGIFENVMCCCFSIFNVLIHLWVIIPHNDEAQLKMCDAK